VASRAKKSTKTDQQTASTEPDQKPQVRGSLAGKPRFVRCQLLGPDGKTRPGWEMWLGEHCFGRADRKEILLKSLERQQQPPQSFHWREVHRQRFERSRGQKENAVEEPDETAKQEG
jgi:hypothetical protein